MAFERRGGEPKYYTRSVRMHGRVTREYVGCGPIGDLAATIDDLDRRERAEQIKAESSQKALLQSAENHLQELCEQSDLLMNATLVEAGFYRRNRRNGKWRLRKMTRHIVNPTPEDGHLAPEWALQSLLRRAERGDMTALHGLQRVLKEDAGMWRTLEKHALQTEEVLFGMVAASRPDLAKLVKKRSAAMKAEISRPHPTRLESLLVQRVVLTRLQACILDALLAEHKAKDGSLSHERYLRSRRDQAHKRYSLVQKRLDLLRELLRESVPESEVQPAPSASGDLTTGV